MASENILTLDKDNFRKVTSAEGKLIFVDYWAQWCGPCRAITPILEKLAGEYPDKLIIGKLNVDEQHELAISHMITGIPTIEIYKDGGLLETIVGSRPYEEFKTAVDRYL